jgi:hypothetical protein
MEALTVRGEKYKRTVIEQDVFIDYPPKGICDDCVYFLMRRGTWYPQKCWYYCWKREKGGRI